MCLGVEILDFTRILSFFFCTFFLASFSLLLLGGLSYCLIFFMSVNISS